jgi:transposase
MDRQYLFDLVDQGLSIRGISKITNKSQTSVRHWLKKYNLKTKHKSFKQGYKNPNKIQKISKDCQICCQCQVKLTHHNSYKKSQDLYYYLCKKCYAAKTLEQRLNFKIKAIKYKGNHCQKCGYDKNIAALEFHHLNPQEKEINPAKLYHKPWEYAKQELDKCTLLCANCHREEHYRQNEIKQQEKVLSLSTIENFSSFILTGANTELPSCKKCDTILTEDNRAAGNKKATCKSCDSKFVMEKNIEGKQRAVNYMGGKCSECGYNNCIRALEFHHVDPTKKSETYNKRFRSWSFERQKKELENCILVCANCHREIHSQDLHSTTPQTVHCHLTPE